MKSVILLAVPILLASCTPSILRAYRGPPLEASQVGIVKASPSRRTIVGVINGYSHVDKWGVPVDRRFDNAPYELHLLPGSYWIQLHCLYSFYRAFPGIPLDVHAGTTYELGCEPVEKGKVQASLVRQFPTPPVAQKRQ
jgi:hypothetical protein